MTLFLAKRSIVLGGLVLTSCSTAQVGTTANQLQQICQAAMPIVQEVQAPGTKLSGTASAIGPYLTASCAADGTVAATLAPNITATTPKWLEGVIAALETAAQLAPVVLPLI